MNLNFLEVDYHLLQEFEIVGLVPVLDDSVDLAQVGEIGYLHVR